VTRLLALGFVLIGLASCGARTNVFSEPRDERLRRFEREQAQLLRTTNPIGRTKVYIRISELLISFMSDSARAGDFEQMDEHVEEYRVAVTGARDTMVNSGRNPARRSAGFRELEIALRQHVRQLDDIGSLLTFDYRQPIEELITEVTEIRDGLIKALFPGQNATSTSK
jgi:hypothetical protein